MTGNFVLDSSLALTWCFEEEATLHTKAVLDSLGEKVKAHVPTLWFWEVTNGLLVAERRRRIAMADAQKHISFLITLPIAVEMGPHQHAWTGALIFARQHRLAIYDAAYLDLAHRLGVPLATVDSSLQKAAEAQGINLL